MSSPSLSLSPSSSLSSAPGTPKFWHKSILAGTMTPRGHNVRPDSVKDIAQEHRAAAASD